MPLKTQLCDSRGQVIEQIFFARLDMPENIAGQRTGAGRAHRGHALGAPGTVPRQRRSPALSAYPASELPPGFRLTVAGAQTLGGATAPGEPSGVLGWTGHRVGFRRGTRSACELPVRTQARARRPIRRCRVWRGWAPASPFPPSCRATKSPRSARCPLRPSNSSRTRSNRPASPQLRAASTSAGAAALSALFASRLRPVRGDAARSSRRCRERRHPGRVARRRCATRRRAARYGHKIPVLLFAGELVCHGRLDPEEVHKALATIADRYNRWFAPAQALR